MASRLRRNPEISTFIALLAVGVFAYYIGSDKQSKRWTGKWFPHFVFPAIAIQPQPQGPSLNDIYVDPPTFGNDDVVDFSQFQSGIFGVGGSESAGR